MKIGKIIVASLLATGLMASGAFAQSAKFAASWDDDVKTVDARIASGGAAACFGDGTGSGTSGDPCVLAEALLTTLDVAQHKDLLIGVSAQIGLITFTQAKGKNTDPTIGSASASGSVLVTLELRDPDTAAVIQTAAPGPVIFAARLQELKVDVRGGDILDPPIEVVVSLLLDTTAAHHFNFLGVDLDQGFYDVVAVFDLSAFVAIVGLEAIAEAKVTLGPRVVTAQEVRAVRGGLDPLVP